MESILEIVARFLASQSLQLGLVFSLVAASCWLLRSASAHWRYLLWLVVIAKCLTPPLVDLPLQVLPRETTRRSTPVTEVSMPNSSLSEAPHPTAAKSDSLHRHLPDRHPLTKVNPLPVIPPADSIKTFRFRLPQALASAWLLVAGVLLAIVGGRMGATQRRLSRLGAPVDEATRLEIAALAQTLGLKRPPRVYQVDFTAQPFVWGWLRGDIYLPAKFSQSGSSDQRRAILTHELAHVARWDAGINHLQNLVQAIFFFHPLVWWANQKLRQEREKCCDEMVLASSIASPKAYCNAIVDMLARECAARAATPGLAVTGSTKNIKERIVTMLTPNRTFLPRPSRTTVVILFCFAAGVLPTAFVFTSRRAEALAAQQDANQSKSSVEIKSFKWKLVDEASNPVAGASVTAIGLRIKESPASGCGWPTNVAPQTEYVTNKEGEIELQYPVKFRLAGRGMTTTQLMFRVRHADFAASVLEVDPTLGESKQILLKGCRATFRAKDQSGAEIKEVAALMAGKAADTPWITKKGEVTSGGIPQGKWQTLLVSPSAEGLHRFSDVLTVSCSPSKEVKLSDVVLKPGMRLRGVLSENVPRPVKNGSVMAWCMPKPAGAYSSEEATLGWGAEAVIAEDGSFEFPSLPRGGQIQLIAVCDGWVVEGVEQALVVGKEIAIDEAQLLANRVDGVKLPMTPAGSVEVEVLNSEGKPLAGATVTSWPNQSLKRSGSTVLGFCYPYIGLMESQITSAPAPKADLTKNARYNLKTDDQGKAIVRDIPIGAPQWLYVGHEDFAMKPHSGTGHDPFADNIRLECKSTDRKKLTVQMVRVNDSNDADEKPAAAQETKLDVTMNKPHDGFDIPPLTTLEMLKVLNERKLSISAEAKKAILEYTEKTQDAPPEIKEISKSLRDGAESVTIQQLAPLLQDKNAQSISEMFAEHQDPVLRFAATLLIASNGDAKATQALHKLIHDKSHSKSDRQVIYSWCNGVGIRPTDSPAEMGEHFANVSRTKPKFQKGDAAPDFELETVSGKKFASKDLRGKIIVLHFWATSCGPCMGQMDSHIAALARYDRNEVEVIFVSLDDEKEAFIAAVKKYKMPFKNVRDERGWGGELARQFGVHSLPFDVIIDAEGKIASNSINDLDKLLTR